MSTNTRIEEKSVDYGDIKKLVADCFKTTTSRNEVFQQVCHQVNQVVLEDKEIDKLFEDYQRKDMGSLRSSENAKYLDILTAVTIQHSSIVYGPMIMEKFKQGKSKGKVYEELRQELKLGIHSKMSRQLIKIIEVTFYKYISDVTKKSYQLGKKPEQIFYQICPNVSHIPLETVHEWFELHRRNGSDLKNEIGPDKAEIIKYIERYYSMYKYGYSTKTAMDCYHMATQRYGYALFSNSSGEIEKLLIYDYFYEQKREVIFNCDTTKSMDIDNELKKFGDVKFVKEIASERFLFIVDISKFGHPKLNVYLIDIDYINWTCKIAECRSYNHNFDSLLFDELDENNLALISTFHLDSTTRKCIMHGHIQNSSLILDNYDKNLIETNANFKCQRLIDNEMYGIQANLDDFPKTFFYSKLDKTNNGVMPLFEFKANSKDREELDSRRFNDTINHTNNNYYWLNDICYTSFEFNFIMALNSNTQKCSIISMNSVGYTPNWLVDNSVLVLQANDYYHRFNFNKPDKLTTIIWFKVKRDKLFFNKNRLYDEMLNRLPLNSEMQPFNMNFRD